MISKTITLTNTTNYGRYLPSKAFGSVLKALPDAIRQSVRMAFEGRSRSRRKRPDWLRAATDIRFLGHDGTDQTNLHFEIPSLGDAAPKLYKQRELWPTRPAAEDTGFDILGDVLTDVAAQNTDSDRFDRPLLDVIAGFRKVFNGTFTGMTWTRRNDTSNPVSLTPSIAETARTLFTNTPQPQRVRIVGKLDMVRASTSSFAVILDGGVEVRGVLSEGEIGSMPALNQRVLVLGKAIYRPSGKLLRLDAEEVTATDDTNSFFSTVPKPIRKKFDLRETIRDQQHKLGIAAIFGKWPGDETDAQVETALKELH